MGDDGTYWLFRRLFRVKEKGNDATTKGPFLADCLLPYGGALTPRESKLAGRPQYLANKALPSDHKHRTDDHGQAALY